MRLRVTCMQCFQELGHPRDELLSVELRDDGLLRVTCPNGHNTITAIQEQKYEILFDLAVMALLDGYPREAATGLAASLERFYEFVIKTLCAKRGVDDATFHASWRLVANQSERQFGAFVFAYMLESSSAPPTIDDDKPTLVDGQDWKNRPWKEFRNAVVHKGYMPSSSEALAYGQLVFNHIQELTFWLAKNCADALMKTSFSHLAAAHAGAGGKAVGTMSIPTALSTTREGFSTRTFAQAVDELKKYKAAMHHA
jgi:hypothetical protein